MSGIPKDTSNTLSSLFPALRRRVRGSRIGKSRYDTYVECSRKLGVCGKLDGRKDPADRVEVARRKSHRRGTARDNTVDKPVTTFCKNRSRISDSRRCVILSSRSMKLILTPLAQHLSGNADRLGRTLLIRDFPPRND